MKLKWYLGLANGGTTRKVFCNEAAPTEESHGAQFAAVIGPFRTARVSCRQISLAEKNGVRFFVGHGQ